MYKLDLLEALFAVVEQSSFNKAAQILSMSSAAVSQKIKLLEKQAGILLLERTTRQLKLTPAGLQFYQYAQQVLSAAQVLNEFTAQFTAEPRGLLRVTYGNYVGQQYLLPKIAEFMARYPHIRLAMMAGEHYADLAEGKTDVLYGMIAEPHDNWVQKSILTMRYVVCASPDYFSRYGIPKIPADLKQHRYINHLLRVEPKNALHFINNQTLLLEPHLSVDDGRDMVNLALAGNGIIKAPDFYIQQYLNDGHLQEVLFDYCLPASSVFLYYLKKQYLHPAVRCFVDFFS